MEVKVITKKDCESFSNILESYLSIGWQMIGFSTTDKDDMSNSIYYSCVLTLEDTDDKE